MKRFFAFSLLLFFCTVAVAQEPAETSSTPLRESAGVDYFGGHTPPERRPGTSRKKHAPRMRPSLAPAFTAQPANGETGGRFKPEVVWGLRYDFFFDNREYADSEINWSQTLFGMRLAPEIGLRWQGHSIMAGVDLLADFGKKPFVDGDHEFFAYYQYHSPKFRGYGGVVPRSKLIGAYSTAFFSDSIKYYDPHLTGLVLQYAGGRGYVEAGFDWNSKIDGSVREKFLLFSAGRLNYKWLYGGYNVAMYHHAMSEEISGVVDNILVHPFVGVDLRSVTCLEALSLQVGWMQALQNDRRFVGKAVSPGGVQIEARVQKWKFGIFNTLYVGKNLMPYYVAPQDPEIGPGVDMDYGPGLYWGDPFYRTGSVYNRLEVYWQPVSNNRMALRVALVEHYDGKKWGMQQKVLLSINLGQNRLWKAR